jgi:cytochrome d ubiquinol oxidase subunit II
VLCAITATLVLVLHGALWLMYKTSGAVYDRTRALASHVWFAVFAASIFLSLASFAVQPRLLRSFSDRPWLAIFPILAIVSLILIRTLQAASARFLASCGFIAGMLTSAAAGIYPYLLPSVSSAHPGLTIHNASATEYGLSVGLIWWIPSFLLATGYVVFLYRRFAGLAQP